MMYCWNINETLNNPSLELLNNKSYSTFEFSLQYLKFSICVIAFLCPVNLFKNNKIFNCKINFRLKKRALRNNIPNYYWSIHTWCKKLWIILWKTHAGDSTFVIIKRCSNCFVGHIPYNDISILIPKILNPYYSIRCSIF